MKQLAYYTVALIELICSNPKNDKRYLVFGYDSYYPMGGISDLISSFNTVGECDKFIKELGHEHIDVYDRIKGETIE